MCLKSRNLITDVPVEGHEFGEAERNGDMVFQGVQEGPEVFAFNPLGVDRESCRLQGLQVPVEGPGMAFDHACQVRCRSVCVEVFRNTL